VNGWKVWNNASVPEQSRVESGMVPIKIRLPSGQNLLVGTNTSIRLDKQRILVEKGCAELDSSGAYALESAKSGLCAGQIEALYDKLYELRPMSQRP